MGWNGYNHFKCGTVDENLVKAQADALVATGMRAAGYQYVNLDDCWENLYRDEQGNLLADPQKFPSGMPALASYVHQLGLKIGLYEDVGTQTCAGRPGSYGHYDQDAATFAAWGIDYIKMDWCHTEGLDPKTQYAQFAQALANANANVTYSICDWGTDLPWQWAPAIANMWRTSPDIGDEWASIINILDAASQFNSAAGPGAWNDPDMLEVGNGGMSDVEDRAHFTMWAMLSAPLIAGNDLTAMSAYTRATLINPEVIAVDQDPLGRQARLISDNGAGLQVWSKQVTGGTVVALLNTSANSGAITANWSEIGLDPSQTVAVRDIWAATDLGSATSSFSALVPSHAVTLLKLGAVSQTPEQTIYEANAPDNSMSGTASTQPCPADNGYSCLDGYVVGNIGGGPDNSVTINNIEAPESGTYNILVYAAIYPYSTFDVSINGATPIQVGISGLRFGVPVASGLVAELHAGANSIRFSNPDSPAPNLDHIVVSGPISVSPTFNFVYPRQNTAIRAPGQTGTINANLVAVGGFSGEVHVSCIVPRSMLSASCLPVAVNLQGQSGVTVPLSITTTAPYSAALQTQIASSRQLAEASPKPMPARHPGGRFGSEIVFVGLTLPFPALAILVLRRRGNRLSKHILCIVWFASVVIIAMNLSACGANLPKCLTVPYSPSNLVASDTGETSTKLSWTMETASPICAVAHFSVFQNNALVGTTDTTSYLVHGLTPSSSYRFQVTASDAAGTSKSSSAVSVKTLSPPPATPAGTYPVTITATSGSITKTSTILVTVE